MRKGMILQFKVTNQTIERLDSNQVYEKSQGYLYAQFIFSEDWRGYTKTVKFSNILTDAYIGVTLGNDNMCIVPHTLILYPAMSICIEGVKGANIITTNSIAIDVLSSESTEPATEVPVTKVTSSDESLTVEKEDSTINLTMGPKTEEELSKKLSWYKIKLEDFTDLHFISDGEVTAIGNQEISQMIRGMVTTFKVNWEELFPDVEVDPLIGSGEFSYRCSRKFEFPISIGEVNYNCDTYLYNSIANINQIQLVFMHPKEGDFDDNFWVILSPTSDFIHSEDLSMAISDMVYGPQFNERNEIVGFHWMSEYYPIPKYYTHTFSMHGIDYDNLEVHLTARIFSSSSEPLTLDEALNICDDYATGEYNYNIQFIQFQTEWESYREYWMSEDGPVLREDNGRTQLFEVQEWTSIVDIVDPM